jgi:hypothetical protein
MSDRITERHTAFAKALARICAEHSVVSLTAQLFIKNDQLDNDYLGINFETTPGFHPKVTIGFGASKVLNKADLDIQGSQNETTVVKFPGTI